MKEILMSKIEYDNLKLEINNIRFSLAQVRKNNEVEKNKSLRYSAEIQLINDDERVVLNHLNELLEKLRCAKVVEQNKQEDIIGLGDTVHLMVRYGEDDIEDMIVTLVGNYNKIGDISINTPLGKAIMNKAVGNIVEFMTPDGLALVNIVAKIDLDNNMSMGR